MTIKNKLGRWALLIMMSLGLHYLMMILAQLLLQGSFSFAGLGQLMTERLTMPGDAERYLDIAKNGYTTSGPNAINLVFYPLYPYLIRIFSCFGANMEIVGMVISQVCFSAATVFFYELISMDQDDRTAWTGALLLNLYPFSIFAMGVFSEGLFLLLTIACMYAIRRHHFLLAGMIGFLASLTRVQGMLLLFPALYEWLVSWRQEKDRKPRWWDCAVLMIPLGFCVYLFINYNLHGDALMFLEFERAEPWYQSTEWLGRNLALQYDLAKEHHQLAFTIYWPQIVLYFAYLAALVYGLFKKERTAYLLYGGVYLGFTYLSGWMISGGRYLFSCFSVLIILSKIQNETARRLLLFTTSLLFFAYSFFYLMGHAIM